MWQKWSLKLDLPKKKKNGFRLNIMKREGILGERNSMY